MTRKEKANWLLFVLPFALSAGWEFLPKWVAMPMMFVGVLKWLNECVVVTEKEQR